MASSAGAHRDARSCAATRSGRILPAALRHLSGQGSPSGWHGLVFRHWGMGVLGRIRFQERPIGGSNLTCETAGDPADPMTAQRAALFEPLGRARADPGSWAARGLCATSVPAARELEPPGVDRMPGPQAAIERSRYRRRSTGMAGARTGRGHGGRRVRCDTGSPSRGALQERLNR